MNEIDTILSQIAQPGLALDIDETLSWTIGIWIQRMQEKFGNPENLSVEEMIAKYRYSHNVPYWKTDEAWEWMEAMRNSDDFQRELPVIEDAIHYVTRIDSLIPIVAYLTIRPHVVRPGTIDWLIKHGFPKAPVICRPASISQPQGNKWKALMLKSLYPKVLGIIDDNKSVVENLEPGYEGVIFLYRNETFGSELNVVCCGDWEDVYKKVRQYFSSR